MGYTAVRGGLDAIEHAEALVEEMPVNSDAPVQLEQVQKHLQLALGRVMAEGGLVDPELAALAIKQAEGDSIEAAFLMRAYRSTLPRLGYSHASHGGEMLVTRRVSSVFRDIPGGQILGLTRDYTQRLLNFDMVEDKPRAEARPDAESDLPEKYPLVIDFLRDEGMMAPAPEVSSRREPFDVTRTPPSFPIPRSGWLQVLARGEAGAMLMLADSSMRGYGGTGHGAVAELRSGEMPVRISHPITGRPVTIGHVDACEVHYIAGGFLSLQDSEIPDYQLGYGLVAGRDERKAISMGIIDCSLRFAKAGDNLPVANQEFVVSHVDSVESSGFVEHLKLPHYVTFQAGLQRSRKFRELVEDSSVPSVAELTSIHGEGVGGYSYGFLDAVSKREIRRSLLKAVAIPGYQVPFGSRELPIARGWGTGGLQITLSLLGPDDVIKVIDQGDDASVNAQNLRRLVEKTSGLETTTQTAEATIIQTRHRVPEEALRPDQMLVLQVPIPEPLRRVERSMRLARQMHAERDYSRMWLAIYEDIVRRGELGGAAGYPVMVNDRFIMAPSPIPRWDIAKLDVADGLYLFGAGREKRLYAIPPYTRVHPLEFEDYGFEVESFAGHCCSRCGATDTFMDETVQEDGSKRFTCSDTAFCDARSGAAVVGGRETL